MQISRVLYIVGLILIIWAVISGLYLQLSSSGGEVTFDSSYTLKIGTLLVGIIFLIVGRALGRR